MKHISVLIDYCYLMKKVKGQVPELPAPAQDQAQIQAGQEYPVYRKYNVYN